jgi:fatty-acyl-CoA synthase
VIHPQDDAVMDGPRRTDNDQALTLPGTLRREATVASLMNPDAGVVTPDDRAPWARVLVEAETLAAHLAELGVPDGGRIALVGDNSVAGVEALFACGLAGAACVPVNTRYSPSEVRRLLADSGADTVVVAGDPELADLVRAALPELDGTDLPIAELPALRRAVVVGADEAGFRRVDVVPKVPAPFRLAGPDDVALIVYTSGTTAHPRGCPLTHETLIRAGRAVGRDRFRCGPDDVLWDVLPLFHLSFVNPLLAILDAGGTFVTDRRFDATRALAQIRAERVSVAFTCFPTVMDALLAHPEFDASFAGVRLMLNVGTPETLRAIQSRAPRTIQLTSYGSSEMAGIAATTHPDDPDDVRLGTNGFPLPGVELTVVDPDTRGPLPTGEPGEVLARGTGLFTGYLGGEPHGPDQWFASGDLGLLDSDGRVHYRGRIKDMVKVGGENVAALEIESVLAGHPAVHTVAVVAAPDARYTEVPAAFVQLHPGADATAEELQDHCAGALAKFKIPRHVRFVTDWPMSSTKIRKGPLREQIAAELRGDP